MMVDWLLENRAVSCASVAPSLDRLCLPQGTLIGACGVNLPLAPGWHPVFGPPGEACAESQEPRKHGPLSGIAPLLPGALLLAAPHPFPAEERGWPPSPLAPQVLCSPSPSLPCLPTRLCQEPGASDGNCVLPYPGLCWEAAGPPHSLCAGCCSALSGRAARFLRQPGPKFTLFCSWSCQPLSQAQRGCQE